LSGNPGAIAGVRGGDGPLAAARGDDTQPAWHQVAELPPIARNAIGVPPAHADVGAPRRPDDRDVAARYAARGLRAAGGRRRQWPAWQAGRSTGTRRCGRLRTWTRWCAMRARRAWTCAPSGGETPTIWEYNQTPGCKNDLDAAMSLPS